MSSYFSKFKRKQTSETGITFTNPEVVKAANDKKEQELKEQLNVKRTKLTEANDAAAS